MKLERKDGGWQGRFRCGNGPRIRVTIMAPDELTAYARAARLRSRIDALVDAGCAVEAARMAPIAAEQKSERAFSEAERAMRDVARESATPKSDLGLRTFGDVFEYWISGELKRRWPQVCKDMGDERVSAARSMFAKHIGGILGSRACADITLEDAEQLLPLIADLRPSSRRKYQTVVKLVMEFSVYPLRLRTSSPIPRKYVEGPGKGPAFSFLYADEEARLVSNRDIELDERVALGFTSRNGTRIGETKRARQRDIDLERGTFTLPKTKTEDARMWKLDEDVLLAMRAYRELLAERGLDVSGNAPLFPGLASAYDARRFRERLLSSGVDRLDLHEPTGDLQRIRIHDLRATFVTLALATGKSDRWVRDRTGHCALVLDKYRRPARTAAELSLDWFAPLHSLLDMTNDVGHDVGQEGQKDLGKAGRAAPHIVFPRGPPGAPGVAKCGDSIPGASQSDAGNPGGPHGSGGLGQLGPVTDELGRCILVEAMQRAIAEGRSELEQRLRLLLDGQLQHVASATRA